MTNQELQTLKNKFDIIGNDPALNRALEIAVAVAPTDITVLVMGESGVGKENIPRIIHQNSRRKNGKYFAINCGAIPEGTIDSELFGHEKGSFTGANDMRREPSHLRSSSIRASSSRLTEVRFSLTRSENFLSRRRPSC